MHPEAWGHGQQGAWAAGGMGSRGHGQQEAWAAGGMSTLSVECRREACMHAAMWLCCHVCMHAAMYVCMLPCMHDAMWLCYGYMLGY